MVMIARVANATRGGYAAGFAMTHDQSIGFTQPPVAVADRAILRGVALAYHRARRAGDMDFRVRKAAMSRYFNLRPEAVSDPLASSPQRMNADRYILD